MYEAPYCIFQDIRGILAADTLMAFVAVGTFGAFTTDALSLLVLPLLGMSCCDQHPGDWS